MSSEFHEVRAMFYRCLLITTVAGNGTEAFLGDGGPPTQAGLSAPGAVAVDAAGNLYITDTRNYRIRKVGANGTITVIAGNGSPGFNALGNLGDDGPATSASLGTSSLLPGLAVDRAGNVYFSDSSNNKVRKIDIAGIISTVAGSGFPGFSGDGGPAVSAALFNPLGLAVDGAGNLYIADASNARVRRRERVDAYRR